MTDDQRQIVLGTLLGNGFICNSKNPYICIQHSCAYSSYFKSKMSHLSEFGRSSPWYKKGNICGWRSISSPIWSEFKTLCYKDGKKNITMTWLNQLRDIGIAVWYGDSGCLIGYKNRNACLRTQSFGNDGNQIACQYFNEVGIECNLNKSKGSHVIVFSVSGTRILFKLVAPYIHPSMYSKLLNV